MALRRWSRVSCFASLGVLGTWGLLLTDCNDSTGTFGNVPGTGATGVGGATSSNSGTVGGGTSVANASGVYASVPATGVTVTPPPDGACHFPASYEGTGSLTWYLFSQGSTEVNCSYAITGRNPDKVEYVATGEGQYFAAMNTADYNSAAMCGACVEVTRVGGTTVTATVVDQCPTASNPKCTPGHLDLSQNAFLQLGTTAEGYLGAGNGGAIGTISWRFVPCPSVGNVSIRLKAPQNKNWNEFLVENHRTPIAKFEALVDGVYVAAIRQTYNFFNVNNGQVKLPLQVRITDTNGAVIEALLPFPPNAEPRIDLGQQFPTCGQ